MIFRKSRSLYMEDWFFRKLLRRWNDIYDLIRDIAIQLEEQEEYGELVGTEVEVTNFRYPEELR